MLVDIYNGKVVLVLKNHAMKMHEGVEVKLHVFLILALNACGQLHALVAL
jgi:hypothetical protein